MNVIEKIEGVVYVDEKMIDSSLPYYIETLAKENFKSIKSMKETSKRITKCERLNPLYISKDIMLVPFYDLFEIDAKCINYLEIKDTIIHRDKTTIFFNDGMIRTFFISDYKFRNLLKKAKLVEDYIRLID